MNKSKIIDNQKPTIGIEVHVELNTKSKMFCDCKNNHYRIKPNIHTCPVCLGLPGSLPVPNKKAIEWTLLIGLGLNCKVQPESKFDRKHYFYPDLPKGYQISQYDEPLCKKGFLDTTDGRISITRVHLEEDTGKLIHKRLKGKDVTLVDFNRSGVPLVEIVTEPEIHSGKQAKEFSQNLRQIIRYLEVSDCDMEKGSMRLEANISWGKHLGYKVEIKNLNSFRFVVRAIDYELSRQRALLDKGEIPKQETRGWIESENKTVEQRTKETAADYRYFPEPDIPPLQFNKDLIKKLKQSLPELPEKVKKRFSEKYLIKENYANVLISEKSLAKYANQAFIIALKEGLDPNEIANALVNQRISIGKVTPKSLVKTIKTSKKAKVSDKKQLLEWIDKSISDTPLAAKDYKKGKKQAIGALIGKVMQLSKGKADASTVKKLIKKKLSN